MYRSERSLRQSAPILALLLWALTGGCGASNPDGNQSGDDLDNTPCSCAVGAKRCHGDQIQVCEATSPTCPSWGPDVSCPSGVCENGACQGSCTDNCQGGTTRCTTDSDVQVCRIGATGCLDWSRQACPAAQFCGGSSCQAAIPCDPACPNGYTCKPSGICAGGSPMGLVLDVKTVKIDGSVTVNGVAPMAGSLCASYPTTETVYVDLRETTRGYAFTFSKLCKDASFGFSGTIFPGTYAVSVRGGYSNIPSASYVANGSLAVTKDTSGVVLDVKTVKIDGSVTVNGAAPIAGSMCASYPTTETVYIDLKETTKGYAFTFSKLCKDASFAFSGTIFPGTYSVSVRGGYSNIPSASYVANGSLAVTKDTSGVVLDVKSVKIDGTVTVNGAAPILGPLCASYPTTEIVYVDLRETTKGYSFTLSKLCKDSSFAFSGTIFPGTYAVSVRGGYSNIPSASYVANASLSVTRDTSGVVLDVKSVKLDGRVTVNGAAPVAGSLCASYPTTETVYIDLKETTKGYSFTLSKLCQDASFAFSGTIFPGTYAASVRGGYSNIPSASYIANGALAVTKDTSGVVLDVRSVKIDGSVTVNGAAPVAGSLCASYPTTEIVYIDLKEKTKGYSFTFSKLCQDASFAFSGTIFPGTYAVSVRGGYSNIPSASYVANDSLAVTKDTSGVVLDVKTLNIAGRVTVNGAPPVAGSLCASYPTTETVYVDLRELTQGYSFTFSKLCQDASFAFSGPIFPGTYAISVRGGYSNIPSPSFVAISRIQIP